MIRRLLACLMLLSLPACDPATAAFVLVGSTAVSLAHSDKTVPDHVASWATGEDCSYLRYSEEEGPYCLTEAELETVSEEPQLVCYRTLGAIDCYETTDPRASQLTQVR